MMQAMQSVSPVTSFVFCFDFILVLHFTDFLNRLQAGPDEGPVCLGCPMDIN